MLLDEIGDDITLIIHNKLDLVVSIAALGVPCSTITQSY